MDESVRLDDLVPKSVSDEPRRMVRHCNHKRLKWSVDAENEIEKEAK